jgi:hypothetical protein
MGGLGFEVVLAVGGFDCDCPFGRGGGSIGGEPAGDNSPGLELCLLSFEAGRVLAE